MIPLTVRSHYSMMQGTRSVRGLCRQAVTLGYTAMALTDRDNLYGMWPFIRACEEEGIKPVIGAEMTDPAGNGSAVCLVKTGRGYRNLCRLITQRHTCDTFDLQQALPVRSDGLLVLTGSRDLLCSWHERGVDLAAAMAVHPLPKSVPLVRSAGRRGIPVVATPDSYFGAPEELAVHKMLRAIENNTCLSRLSAKDIARREAWLAPPEAYRRRFATCPEAVKNSRAAAEKIEFRKPCFGTVMPPYRDRKGRSAERLLREKVYAAAGRRYGRSLSQRVVNRIEHELDIIGKKGFAGYFLVVHEIVSNSSRICGRGSGAASIVAYCLGITNVCPLKYNLYFERFLNPGRNDPPDIDVDFAWDERDDILAGVLAKYREYAAMVANHVLFQPRMALRECAKVFGLPDAEINAVTKKLPWFWKRDTAEPDLLAAVSGRPEFRGMGFPEPWPAIMAAAEKIIGAPRYISVHPGGVVITPRPVSDYVPLETAAKGVPVIQWEKDGAEDAGLVKIDLLGNRSLGVIRDAVRNIRDSGIAFDDFKEDPEDDPETQQTVAFGNTMGCFYIESPAMRLLQKKSKVGSFAYVVIHSSIIRPAANEFIKEYLERLHGAVYQPVHPLLDGALGDTFGLMVFQEDVSKVAVALAGFSHEDADGLRKILSKKDRQRVLQDFYDRFVAGAEARGVTEKAIASIWKMITSFSGYSFCKAHSASYARVSFQAAWLKTHYPAAFMAAVISNRGGFYSTFAYVSEAGRMGLTVLPPDVNRSGIAWKGRGQNLRAGLEALKGVSQTVLKRIVAERKKEAFKSAADFFHRVDPLRNEAEALIQSGALDSISRDMNRAQILWRFLVFRRSREREEPLPTESPRISEVLPDLPAEAPLDRLRKEFAVLGFLCQGHPMALYRPSLQGSGAVTARDLPRMTGQRVRFAGWLITRKKVATKQNDPMAFLTFEDETGLVETVFFPRAHHRFCHITETGKPFLLTGVVESDWGAVTLNVDHVQKI